MRSSSFDEFNQSTDESGIQSNPDN